MLEKWNLWKEAIKTNNLELEAQVKDEIDHYMWMNSLGRGAGMF